MTNGAHWVGLKELMGHPPWLDEFDDDWLEFSVTPEKVATFHRGFAAWIRDQAKDAVAEKAQRLGRAAGPGQRRRRSARVHRSTATAVSSATSHIRCSARRPIPRCRT